ncbi:MAG: 4-hydroxythreonine-4-phosphate dehydrogenase PdxA [bacterium]|nr:4-hydroxythreonine-4-phosphate dehydrogenase PdxA [bacterium]
MKTCLPKIGITMGDPAGIGPEIVIKALSGVKKTRDYEPLILGDYELLLKCANEMRSGIRLVSVETPDQSVDDGSIAVLSLTSLGDIKPGSISKEGGHASGIYIEKGANLAMDGLIDGIVTAPINKESFNKGGFSYPGHTEFLAHLTATENYAMMLMGDSLKVILLTIHCALMEVAGRLSRADTLRIIRLSNDSLKKYFGIKKPRLALASLNPHAGEAGLFGREEEDILIPASKEARKEGIDVTLPLPSDTLFFSAVRGAYDAVICPYHDQGLIPLKLLHFEDGVNVTLGLPIVRTSPDHGTAYDIAGKGIASSESIEAAIKVAVGMVRANINLK